MIREKREYDIEVLKLEKGIEKPLKVTFNSEIGQYPVEVGQEYFDLFFPGKKYRGIFTLSGMPDFIGDENKWENVCTVSFSLEKILDEKTIIYENK